MVHNTLASNNAHLVQLVSTFCPDWCRRKPSVVDYLTSVTTNFSARFVFSLVDLLSSHIFLQIEEIANDEANDQPVDLSDRKQSAVILNFEGNHF